MKKLIIILAVIAAFTSCALPGPGTTGDKPIDKPTQGVTKMSSNVRNAKAFSKGSPVYYIDSTGAMVPLIIYDANQQPINTEVSAISRAGTNYLLVAMANNTSYLLHTSDGLILDITGKINNDFLYAQETIKYIYFGNAHDGSLYQLTK